MVEICDPLSGWNAPGHVWGHCKGLEEACILAELIGLSSTYALVKITPSFAPVTEEEIEPGSYKEYVDGDTVWRVYCDGVNASERLASIRICYEEVPCSDHTTQAACEAAGCYWRDGACHSEEEVPCSDHTTQAACEAAGCYWRDGVCHSEEEVPCSDHTTQAACEAAGCYWRDGACHSTAEGDIYDIPLYGSVTVLGNTFTNTKLLCATAQAVIRPEGLAAKTLTVGGAGVIFAVGSLILPGSIFTTGVIMGGIYMSLREIDVACTTATVDIFNAAYTEEDHEDVVQTVTDDLTDEGFTVGNDPDDDFTSEEVDNATRQAEENVKNSKEEKQRQEDVINGVKTPEEAEVEREAQIATEAQRILIADNFTLDIPTFVMAGDVVVSGWAPEQNQELQIMGVKMLFGFDWLASDTELAKVTSDANYAYEATLTLDEFGIIEVYSKIPKEWWAFLEADVTTTKYTVFVMTWTSLIALIIVAALVYDKASGGKLKKMLKG